MDHFRFVHWLTPGEPIPSFSKRGGGKRALAPLEQMRARSGPTVMSRRAVSDALAGASPVFTRAHLRVSAADALQLKLRVQGIEAGIAV